MSEAARPPAEFDFPLSWAGPDGIGETHFDEVAEAQRPDVGEGDDPAVALRRTLGMFATGVTVVTTLKGEQVHGMTANAFMSVSLEPPLVLVSIDRRTRMCGLLHVGGHYGVSVLCETQSALSDRFAGRAANGAAEPRFDARARDAARRGGAGSLRGAASSTPTGAATTRSSSAASSTRASTPARRCSSTAGATSEPLEAQEHGDELRPPHAGRRS